MFIPCRICGRALKSKESQAKGIGPCCEKKLGVIKLRPRKTECDEASQYKLDLDKVEPWPTDNKTGG